MAIIIIMKTRRILITAFSIIFIIFGLSGVVFSSYGILFLNSHKEDIDNIHRLGLSAVETVEEVAIVLEGSDEKSANIAESIRVASDSIEQASGICNDAGISFNKIAGIVGFEILGFNPLKETEEYFNDVGDDLIILSEELSKAGDDLEINASDVGEISLELNNISEKVEDVSTRLNKEINSFSIYNLILYVRYLLIYLCVLNVIFILNGLAILILGR